VTYRKIGGIHFVKIWRFGFNFYISGIRPSRSNTKNAVCQAAAVRETARFERARRRSWNLARLRGDAVGHYPER